MSPKDCFWTGLQGGLLDKKHYIKMGMSIWLFGYLTRTQTALNKAGEGVVNYGHPLTLERISEDLKGISVRTVRLWTTRLRREGYVRTEEHGHCGLTFWIMKAKQKTKQPKICAEASRHISVRKPETSRHDSVTKQDASRYPVVTKQDGIPAQSFADACLAANSDSPTPKGFTSENLLYYNSAAAAKAAAVSLTHLAKEKSIPRGKTPRELDERRRFLLRQSEELEARYGKAHA